MSIYYDGVTPAHLPTQVDDVEWMLPEEYLKTEENPKPKAVFVKNDSSSNEVKQGNIGNCWFISALSVLASHDELIRGATDGINKDTLEVLDKTTALALS